MILSDQHVTQTFMENRWLSTYLCFPSWFSHQAPAVSKFTNYSHGYPTWPGTIVSRFMVNKSQSKLYIFPKNVRDWERSYE